MHDANTRTKRSLSTCRIPINQGFPIVFRTTGGEEKVFYFAKKPLGFKFKETAPIIVSKVTPGSHAEERKKWGR